MRLAVVRVPSLYHTHPLSPLNHAKSCILNMRIASSRRVSESNFARIRRLHAAPAILHDAVGPPQLAWFRRFARGNHRSALNEGRTASTVSLHELDIEQHATPLERVAHMPMQLRFTMNLKSNGRCIEVRLQVTRVLSGAGRMASC